MAQAARTPARRVYTPAQRGAIAAKRASARRARDASKNVDMVDPALLAACIDAAGFADHAAY